MTTIKKHTLTSQIYVQKTINVRRNAKFLFTVSTGNGRSRGRSTGNVNETAVTGF
jgi:hypothetical protein